MRLYQTDYITTREFELGAKELMCKEKNISSSLELTIPYEYIDVNQLFKRSVLPSSVPWIAGILGMIFIGFIRTSMNGSESLVLIIVGGIILWRVTLLFKRNEILIPTGKGELIIWEDTPDKNAVSEFIVELTFRIKDLYIKKYGTYDKDLPIDTQLSNIMFLKEKEVITDEEFDEMKNRIIGKTNSTNNPIGFR